MEGRREISLVNARQTSGQDQPGIVPAAAGVGAVLDSRRRLRHHLRQRGLSIDFKKGVHPTRSYRRSPAGINWRHMILDAKTHYFRAPACGSAWAASPRVLGGSRHRDPAKAGHHTRIVSAGGTPHLGDRFGKPWVVRVRDPDHERVFCLPLPTRLFQPPATTNATSAKTEEVSPHHRSKTGDSARKCRSVTIIA